MNDIKITDEVLPDWIEKDGTSNLPDDFTFEIDGKTLTKADIADDAPVATT